MRLFVLTISNKRTGEELEFCQFNASLVELATVAANMRFRVRAIEEIDATTEPPFPIFSNLTIGQAEDYRFNKEGEELIFPTD